MERNSSGCGSLARSCLQGDLCGGSGGAEPESRSVHWRHCPFVVPVESSWEQGASEALRISQCGISISFTTGLRAAALALLARNVGGDDIRIPDIHLANHVGEGKDERVSRMFMGSSPCRLSCEPVGDPNFGRWRPTVREGKPAIGEGENTPTM